MTRSQRPSRSPSRRNGQSLVEFALVLPVLLFLLLAFAEAAFLFADRHTAQSSADALADIAAERMATMPGESWNSGWNELVTDEAARADCSNPRVEVTFPDETHNPGDRVDVRVRCAYVPVVTNGLWPGLQIDVRGVSVVRSP